MQVCIILYCGLDLCRLYAKSMCLIVMLMREGGGRGRVGVGQYKTMCEIVFTFLCARINCQDRHMAVS